jgi:hypothetical protein
VNKGALRRTAEDKDEAGAAAADAGQTSPGLISTTRGSRTITSNTTRTLIELQKCQTTDGRLSSSRRRRVALRGERMRANHRRNMVDESIAPLDILLNAVEQIQRVDRSPQEDTAVVSA